MSIALGKVLPNLLRELQWENNCGECSHINFSLYFKGIANMVAIVSKYISISMVECAGALAIYRNSLSIKASYVGVDFRGDFASASLKQTITRWAPASFTGFPRRFCLGLIEASVPSKLLEDYEAISEAILPRPH